MACKGCDARREWMARMAQVAIKKVKAVVAPEPEAEIPVSAPVMDKDKVARAPIQYVDVPVHAIREPKIGAIEVMKRDGVVGYTRETGWIDDEK